MTNTAKLKEYLIDKENAFLINDDNNKKTIMLSGAWGAGKTHFWQEEIEPTLKTKLHKDKACVYVSLYGKDNLDSLKQEVLIKAFSDNQLLSDEVSTFGVDALSSIKDGDFLVGKLIKSGVDYNNSRKSKKGKNKIKDGGVICFDDFERKSKEIDLNDLFGFISQLSIEMNCKVVIILNSDVFNGKEAEVFKRVKEKTVNKFFYFNPTIEELFESISKDEKYDKLNDYKSKILETIKETEELNARIYVQVLDNCLEWVESGKNIDDKVIRVLVLTTINFVLNHIILDYAVVRKKRTSTFFYNPKIHFVPYFTLLKGITRLINLERVSFLQYNIITDYSILLEESHYTKVQSATNYINSMKYITEDDRLQDIMLKAIQFGHQKSLLTEKSQDEHLKWIKENEFLLKAVWKYGYRLYYVGEVLEEVYKEIAEFVESGILL